ncbi:MAG: peroxiredoxin [Gemmatimonadota bacterium]
MENMAVWDDCEPCPPTLGDVAASNVYIGARAPDFALPVHTGGWLRLWDMIGRKAVVLYFYPSDGTPGCILEARAFRDRYDEFAVLESEIIGVSGDSLQSHRRFANRMHLPFPLLSDEAGTARRIYGVEKTLGFIPGRATFVIDKTGIVRHIYASQFAPARHADEALDALRRLTV